MPRRRSAARSIGAARRFSYVFGAGRLVGWTLTEEDVGIGSGADEHVLGFALLSAVIVLDLHAVTSWLELDASSGGAAASALLIDVYGSSGGGGDTEEACGCFFFFVGFVVRAWFTIGRGGRLDGDFAHVLDIDDDHAHLALFEVEAEASGFVFGDGDFEFDGEVCWDEQSLSFGVDVLVGIRDVIELNFGVLKVGDDEESGVAFWDLLIGFPLRLAHVRDEQTEAEAEEYRDDGFHGRMQRKGLEPSLRLIADRARLKRGSASAGLVGVRDAKLRCFVQVGCNSRRKGLYYDGSLLMNGASCAARSM